MGGGLRVVRARARVCVGGEVGLLESGGGSGDCVSWESGGLREP